MEELEEAATTNIMMAALSTLTQQETVSLTNSVAADLFTRRCRLFAVLSSPALFSLTLNRLRLLSFPAKTALLARHLLSSLRRLTSRHRHSSPAELLRPRDLDAVALLLLMCDVRLDGLLRAQPAACWRDILCEAYIDDMLAPCTSTWGTGSAPQVLVPCMEEVGRCMRFVMTTNYQSSSSGAAAAAAVVALPSVEAGGGKECAICKEEMREGIDVCRVPCRHLFHWKCALTWLSRNNTCPCCRFQLPTDDVFREIRRLWDVLVRMGRTGNKELI